MVWLAQLALGLVSWSCTTAGSDYPVPEPRIATGDPQDRPRTACIHDGPYDGERGCVEHRYGVPAEVTHRNEMSDSFQLVGAAMFLDGERMLDTNDPALLGRRSFPVCSTGLRSGHHDLGVVLVYRGRGQGIFSYLAGYTFRVRANHGFEARGDEPVTITVVGYEQGGATAPLEERPAIRFE